MSPIPTFVVDYPEAHAAMERIALRHGITPAGVLPSLGENPVSRSMKPHPLPAEPFLVVNGSGDYHHETVPLVEGFVAARPEGRFTYIQIDAHPDKTERFRWLCDCGSFVGRILRNPRIDNVHLLGLNLRCILEDWAESLCTRHLPYYGCNYFGKLRQYVAAGEDIEELFFRYEAEDLAHARENPSVASVRAEARAVPPLRPDLPAALVDDEELPALVVTWRTLEAFEPEALPDLPVYLSVDLDVSREKPITDWRRRDTKERNRFGVLDNEGVMEWGDVLSLIRRIAAARRIVAGDFCGLTAELEMLDEEGREMSLEAVAEIYGVMAEAVRGG